MASIIWLTDHHAECIDPGFQPLLAQGRLQPGGPQPSFDKQFLRDYLETLDWNKTAPAPPLPEHIVAKTGEKYMEALVRLTGKGK